MRQAKIEEDFNKLTETWKGLTEYCKIMEEREWKVAQEKERFEKIIQEKNKIIAELEIEKSNFESSYSELCIEQQALNLERENLSRLKQIQEAELIKKDHQIMELKNIFNTEKEKTATESQKKLIALQNQNNYYQEQKSSMQILNNQLNKELQLKVQDIEQLNNLIASLKSEIAGLRQFNKTISKNNQVFTSSSQSLQSKLSNQDFENCQLKIAELEKSLIEVSRSNINPNLNSNKYQKLVLWFESTLKELVASVSQVQQNFSKNYEIFKLNYSFFDSQVEQFSQEMKVQMVKNLEELSIVVKQNLNLHSSLNSEMEKNAKLMKQFAQLKKSFNSKSSELNQARKDIQYFKQKELILSQDKSQFTMFQDILKDQFNALFSQHKKQESVLQRIEDQLLQAKMERKNPNVITNQQSIENQQILLKLFKNLEIELVKYQKQWNNQTKLNFELKGLVNEIENCKNNQEIALRHSSVVFSDNEKFVSYIYELQQTNKLLSIKIQQQSQQISNLKDQCKQPKEKIQLSQYAELLKSQESEQMWQNKYLGQCKSFLAELAKKKELIAQNQKYLTKIAKSNIMIKGLKIQVSKLKGSLHGLKGLSNQKEKFCRFINDEISEEIRKSQEQLIEFRSVKIVVEQILKIIFIIDSVNDQDKHKLFEFSSQSSKFTVLIKLVFDLMNSLKQKSTIYADLNNTLLSKNNQLNQRNKELENRDWKSAEYKSQFQKLLDDKEQSIAQIIAEKQQIEEQLNDNWVDNQTMDLWKERIQKEQEDCKQMVKLALREKAEIETKLAMIIQEKKQMEEKLRNEIKEIQELSLIHI
eukprot:TRINITY_DN9144_c0_g1_i7.p1 TRINITY_DN9144_c0_g1~~TRINITY_DN9144_c0_g1_i7.p1  ORF type:complete len:815 (+),score=164.57 TRINITY_DN9144_c0_g1_i7:508-2952(+)